MGEDIKSDLAGIAITHPFFAVMVTNALNYIEKLEKENKTLKNFTSDIFNEDVEKEFIPKSKVKEKFQNKRNEIFGCTYVDDEQWKPFDKALDIINDLEQELLRKE